MKSNLPTKHVNTHGTVRYTLDKEFHREDGPALEFPDGNRYWYRYGKYHREDGPAFEYGNGHKEWWLHGERIDCNSQEEFERILKLKALW